MIYFFTDKKKDKDIVGPTEFLSERQRIVYLSDIVTTPSGDAISTAPYYLLALNEENPTKPIRLLIDSDGGGMQSFLFIYDLIIGGIKAPVYTLALGRCYSAAVLPFIAGEKGKRFCLPHTEFILHLPQVAQTRKVPTEELPQREQKGSGPENILCVPKEEQMVMRSSEELIKRMKASKELIKNIFRVHLKLDKVEDLIKRTEQAGQIGPSMFPEEAIEVGIADKILTRENRKEFFDE